MNNKKCLIINTKGGFVGDFLLQQGYVVRSPWKNDHFSNRKYNILKIINKQHWLYGFNKADVQKYKNILVFETDKVSSIIKDIRRWNKDADIRLMMWNIVRPYFIEEIKKVKEENVKIYTFDKDDCDKYKLNYSDTIYPYDDEYFEVSNNIEYDCYCCMANKGRIGHLLSIKDTLDKHGLKYLFQVVVNKSDEYKEYENICILKKQISYKSYLENLYKSKCVIEILQEGQSGITWRTYESLFYDKKLITNNQRIIEYDFYNPNNIFVINNNLDEIKDFLDRPYMPIAESIKTKYMCDNIIKKIFE